MANGPYDQAADDQAKGDSAASYGDDRDDSDSENS